MKHEDSISMKEYKEVKDLVKDIKHYGARVYSKDIETYTTIYVYQYNNVNYVMIMNHGVVISMFMIDRMTILM